MRPGQDCVSPSRHAEFSDTDSLLDWVELLAAETGLPVGIKSAAGDLGVATQNAWLTRGLDPALKSVRAANYIKTFRRNLFKVAEACGVEHPGLIGTDAVEVLDGRTASTPLREVYGYAPGWGMPAAADQAEIIRLMTTEPQGGTAPPSASAATWPPPTHSRSQHHGEATPDAVGHVAGCSGSRPAASAAATSRWS